MEEALPGLGLLGEAAGLGREAEEVEDGEVGGDGERRHDGVHVHLHAHLALGDDVEGPGGGVHARLALLHGDGELGEAEEEAGAEDADVLGEGTAGGRGGVEPHQLLRRLQLLPGLVPGPNSPLSQHCLLHQRVFRE